MDQFYELFEDATLDAAANYQEVEGASGLFKAFKAIQRHLYEELRNRKIKKLETEDVMNYNTTIVNSLGGISDEKAVEEQGTRRTSYNDGRNGQDNSLHNGRMGPDGVDQEDSRNYTDDDGTANIGHTRKGRNVGWGMDSNGRRISKEVFEKTRESVVRNEEGAIIAVYHATDKLNFSSFSSGDVGFHLQTRFSTLGEERKIKKTVFRLSFLVGVNGLEPLTLCL